MILIPKVQAKTINTLNVTESNGKINNMVSYDCILPILNRLN